MSCQGLASRFCRILPGSAGFCRLAIRSSGGVEGIMTVTADEIRRAAEVHSVLLLAQTNSDY